MKKLFFIACAAMTLAIAPLFSCNKAESVPNEEKLQLEAPSGQRIAASASDLMKQSSTIINELFGKKQSFQLTGIEYLNVSKGYAAIISYQLSDGTVGNFATIEGVSFKTDAASISTRKPAKQVKDDTVLADESGSRVSLVCQKIPPTSCPCKIKGILDLITGVITWKCDCTNDCEMVIIIS